MKYLPYLPTLYINGKTQLAPVLGPDTVLHTKNCFDIKETFSLKW
jgi:hypothetical protein